MIIKLLKKVNKMWLLLFVFVVGLNVPVYSVTTLKWAHVYEVESPFHQGALLAAKNFKKATDGKYEIKVYPASSLGKEVAIVEGLSFGTIDIVYTSPSVIQQSYPPIVVSDYPYVFRDFKHWELYSKSDIFKKLSRNYSKASDGNTIMAISYYGARHVTSNKPILKPTDMKGLKIRVPNAPTFFIFPKAMDANPTPLAFSEVYLALQQGVVDAQENPLPTIKFKKFYEVQSDINLTSHMVNSLVSIVSGATLKKLSKRTQNQLRDSLKMGAKFVSADVNKQEQELVSWFRKKGNKVNKINKQLFIDKVSPVYKKGNLPFSYDIYEDITKLGK